MVYMEYGVFCIVPSLSLQKPAEICKILGLCGSCDKQEKMLQYFVQEALQAAGTSENVSKVQLFEENIIKCGKTPV